MQKIHQIPPWIEADHTIPLLCEQAKETLISKTQTETGCEIQSGGKRLHSAASILLVLTRSLFQFRQRWLIYVVVNSSGVAVVTDEQQVADVGLN